MTKALSLFLLLIMSLFTSACVHKLDVQQGNVITQEMLEKLSIGMQQRQVLGTIGTPMVIDPFRSERWDYVYSMKSSDNDEYQFSYITLLFKQGKLDNIVVHEKPLKEEEIRSMEESARQRRS
jgi:outer membrane protein assembly factor BamE